MAYPVEYTVAIRLTGLIAGLNAAGIKTYQDHKALRTVLERLCKFPNEEVERIVQLDGQPIVYEKVNLSDRVAAYFGWCAEEAKRIYVRFRAAPHKSAASGYYALSAEFKNGVTFSEPLVLSSDMLLSVLKLVNYMDLLHWKWERDIREAKTFAHITVPSIWERALKVHGIERNNWLATSMPLLSPILVFADAIRYESFTKEHAKLYRTYYRYTCPQCAAEYALVMQVTDQAKFESIAPFNTVHFQFLCQRIKAEHPDHRSQRIRTSGTSTFAVEPFIGAPVFLSEEPTSGSAIDLLKSGVISPAVRSWRPPRSD